MAHGFYSAAFEHRCIAGRVKVEKRHAELKTLRPLRPAAGRVFTLHRKNRGTLAGVPGGVDRADFFAGEFKHAGGFFRELGRSKGGVDFHNGNVERTTNPADCTKVF